MMRKNNALVRTNTLLQAQILDALHLNIWMKTKDAEKGRNRPKSIAEQMLIHDDDITAFETGEELLAELERRKRLHDV